MQLHFKTSKLANLFFLVSNFSEWHFSCRTDYNRAWIEKTKPLKIDEVEALSKFKKVINKYGFELSKIFYTNNEEAAWKNLRKITKESEFTTIKETLQIFKPKFEKIWQISKLNKRIGLIKKGVNRKEYQKLIEDACCFLGNQSPQNDIEIIVLFFTSLRRRNNRCRRSKYRT